MKKKALISFSGGETSGYMLWWLLTHKSEEYDFTITFANTGRENEETLEFVKKCGDYFNVNIIWLEAVIRFKVRYFRKTKTFLSFEEKEKFINSFTKEQLQEKEFWKKIKTGEILYRPCIAEVNMGTTHKIVNYETATRNQDWKNRDNTPYEMMVKKYGLANISSRISTRELKERPIHSYMKSLGLEIGGYETFIGIRVDEFDRMSVDKGRYNLAYPLIKWKPTTKPQINFWWSLQPFRLNLKGWEGNCVTCYKKSIKKLTKIMQDDPWKFEFDEYLEEKYGYYIPKKRLLILENKGKSLPELPIRIFRSNTTVEMLRDTAEKEINLTDDSLENDNTDEEACEVFSQCGINN